MSTNPFRQTRVQQDVQTAAATATATNPPAARSTLSDDFGSRLGGVANETGGLSLDLKDINAPFGRHVSFASPPVDSTIPAASYPSSPESIRSPPNYFARTGALATPDYRAAIQSDPFEDLNKDRQDGTLQQAVLNAQSNIAVGQPPGQQEQPRESAVWDTLGGFAAAPSRPSPAQDPSTRPALQEHRKSLDVDAFKRLLLTGNTEATAPQEQQNTRRPAPPPPPRSNPQTSAVASTVPETTFTLPSSDAAGLNEIDEKRASFINSLIQPGHEPQSSDSTGKLPPPAPAPRRVKSVKTRDISPVPTPPPSTTDPVRSNEDLAAKQEKAPKKPPTPPLARRQSQRIPSNKSDDSINTPSPAISPAEPARPTTKPPPPPPIRRQSSVTSRRPSQELAPTIEEPEPEPEAAPTLGSRNSSIDRPTPTGSRNSSISVKRPMPGLMSPPPLPPPRKGRGSSRSSMDGFRPSLATLMGGANDQDNTSTPEQLKQATSNDRSSLTASNANSILAELASLQQEVDAARRT